MLCFSQLYDSFTFDYKKETKTSFQKMHLFLNMDNKKINSKIFSFGQKHKANLQRL